MPSHARFTLPWADGDHAFDLTYIEVIDLETALDAGPMVIFDRLRNGSWKVRDVSAVIRHALIGGGMTPTDALLKVKRYVEARPPAENVGLAAQIMAAYLYGIR